MERGRQQGALSLRPASARSPAPSTHTPSAYTPSTHTPAGNHYSDFHSNDIFYKEQFIFQGWIPGRYPLVLPIFKMCHVLTFLLFHKSLLFSSFPTVICGAASFLCLPDSPAVWVLLIASPARSAALCTLCILIAGSGDRVRLGLNPFLKTWLGVWPDRRGYTISDAVSPCHVNGHRFLMPVPTDLCRVVKGNILILLSLLLTICQLTFQEFKENVI